MNTDIIAIKKRQFVSSDYEDKRISSFIISFYFAQMLNLVVKNTFNIPENLYPKVSVLFGSIFAVFFIMTILTVLKRSLVQFFSSEFFLMCIFFISYLMGNAENSLLLNNAFWGMAICIPLGVYAYSLNNKKVFYNMFLKSSFIMTFILSLSFFSHSEDIYYSMSLSYALLVPTIFHINEWFKTKKKLYLVFFLVEIGEIILYGSRGPLISLAFFFILKFIFSNAKLSRKLGIIFIILLIFTILYFNFDRMGASILSHLSQKGYYSRSLTLLFSNKISDDSGRFELFRYYFDLIIQKPLLGWGVLGGWIGEGSGPHNMIIEFFLALGIVFGGLITLFLILLQFWVFAVKNENDRDLIAIYMSICIVLFFISGDFFKKPNFFIFLGLVLKSFKKGFIRE